MICACASSHQMFFLEALENAPQGEDSERERERERERKRDATNTHQIVDPIGQDHLP